MANIDEDDLGLDSLLGGEDIEDSTGLFTGRHPDDDHDEPDADDNTYDEDPNELPPLVPGVEIDDEDNIPPPRANTVSEHSDSSEYEMHGEDVMDDSLNDNPSDPDEDSHKTIAVETESVSMPESQPSVEESLAPSSGNKEETPEVHHKRGRRSRAEIEAANAAATAEATTLVESAPDLDSAPAPKPAEILPAKVEAPKSAPPAIMGLGPKPEHLAILPNFNCSSILDSIVSGNKLNEQEKGAIYYLAGHAHGYNEALSKVLLSLNTVTQVAISSLLEDIAATKTGE